MTSRGTAGGRGARWIARCATVFALLAASAASLRSQEPAADTAPFLSRLGLDRLRFSGIGVMSGVAVPVHMRRAPTISLVTDYGEIAPGYRVVFMATYWNSELDRRAVRAFADSLRRVVIDPSGDDSVRVAGIRVSDISLGGELRRSLSRSGWLRPYLGGGMAMHVLNADGPLIEGTFVERVLDNIAFGFAGVAGLDVRLLRHFTLGAQARYDLLSLARYASVRAGATYFFDAAPRRQTPER